LYPESKGKPTYLLKEKIPLSRRGKKVTASRSAEGKKRSTRGSNPLRRIRAARGKGKRGERTLRRAPYQRGEVYSPRRNPRFFWGVDLKGNPAFYIFTKNAMAWECHIHLDEPFPFSKEKEVFFPAKRVLLRGRGTVAWKVLPEGSLFL